MKKLMKKKVSIFGKEFSLFTIALIGLAVFASAALVPYISNAVTGNVTIKSPVTLGISLTNSHYSDSVNVGTMYGSDNFSLWTKLTNNAKHIMSSNSITIVVTNSLENVACGDFGHLGGSFPNPFVDRLLEYNQNGGLIDDVYCDQNTDGSVSFIAPSIIISPGETQIFRFAVTSAANIEPAEYTFKIQVPY